MIHGQVMVGWVVALDIGEIVLADDKTASDEWRAEVLREAVESFSEEVKLTVLSLKDGVNHMAATVSHKRMLLVETLADAFELYALGLKIPVLNLGSVHSRKGRVELLPFLFLDSSELSLILELAGKGIKITAQDLPLSRAYDVIEVIKKKGLS